MAEGEPPRESASEPEGDQGLELQEELSRLVLPEPDPSWLAQAMQRLQEPPEPESDQDSAGTNP